MASEINKSCHNPYEYIGSFHETCWHFVVDYYSQIGIHLATCAYRNAALFTAIDDPVDGCLVILGTYNIAGHCAIYHSGHVFHLTRALGVIKSKPEQFENRVYYEYSN